MGEVSAVDERAQRMHQQLVNAWPRVAARTVVDENGCMIWLGAKLPSGYGQTGVGLRSDRTRRMAYTHRIAYTATVGPIPEGFQIDHLCRNTSCCNPDHLEAVTPRENLLRSNSMSGRWARRTHCSNGHAYDEANTGYYRGARRCRACEAAKARAYRAAKKENAA